MDEQDKTQRQVITTAIISAAVVLIFACIGLQHCTTTWEESRQVRYRTVPAQVEGLCKSVCNHCE